MVVNFAFLKGMYNGSTISILGRDQILQKVREIPVVKCSGMLRFSHGYALAKTFRIDQKVADVEYDRCY